MGHRRLPPRPAPRAPASLLLWSRAAGACRQGHEIVPSSGLGPDWLGRQDQNALVSSLSLSLKVSLLSPRGLDRLPRPPHSICPSSVGLTGPVRSSVLVGKRNEEARAKGRSVARGMEIRRRDERLRRHTRPQR